MTNNTSITKKHTLFSNFKELTKIGLTISVLVSSIAGYFLAAEKININTLMLLIVGGFCMVGASNIYNQIIEVEPDKLMKRTKDRPLPTGRVSIKNAMILAVTLTILGITALYLINPKTAMFSAISVFLYTSAYTPLKPVSPISVFVGAIPGAIPFMLGWVAATGNFGIEAGILFMIQFFWQFPHFWAIGWMQYDEYKKAGFNMMPTNTKGKTASRLIVIYTVIMIFISLIPVLHKTGDLFLSPIAAIFVFISGIMMLIFSIKLHKNQSDSFARKLMLSSVIYITLIQIIYVVDKYLH